MKIYDSIIQERKYEDVSCGTIVDVTKKGILVSTKDGSILLTKIKPFGKKTMDAGSYINGIGKEKLLGQVFE